MTEPPAPASLESFPTHGRAGRVGGTGCCPYVSLTWLSQRDSIAIVMAKARYHYNIMLRPEPEGGYTALVPALPGCVTYGKTVDEAREMAKDAISGYIASLRKHKDPIPSDDNTLVASLDLEYSR